MVNILFVNTSNFKCSRLIVLNFYKRSIFNLKKSYNRKIHKGINWHHRRNVMNKKQVSTVTTWDLPTYIR